MVEAAPAAAFVVPEPNLLLELLVVALDAPAQLGEIDQALEGDLLGQAGKPVLGRLGFAFRPFDQQPFLRPRRGELVVVMCRADPQPGEARPAPAP